MVMQMNVNMNMKTAMTLVFPLLVACGSDGEGGDTPDGNRPPTPDLGQADALSGDADRPDAAAPPTAPPDGPPHGSPDGAPHRSAAGAPDGAPAGLLRPGV
jgi:hypothetical protein